MRRVPQTAAPSGWALSDTSPDLSRKGWDRRVPGPGARARHGRQMSALAGDQKADLGASRSLALAPVAEPRSQRRPPPEPAVYVASCASLIGNHLPTTLRDTLPTA